jgi:hypothetical protein
MSTGLSSMSPLSSSSPVKVSGATRIHAIHVGRGQVCALPMQYCEAPHEVMSFSSSLLRA